MDDFTSILYVGMRDRGHNVQVWQPLPTFSNLSIGRRTRKWLGYLDQFIVFPSQIRRRMKKCEKDTLFVFTDQALGPWVPLVRSKRHIIHCHDFLALQSACGLIPENVTSWTGRYYQNFIRDGFSQGKNFIAVSNKTSEQLTRFHKRGLIRTEVVYNGLKQNFAPLDPIVARRYIHANAGILVPQGYILHVGGNQWYKNRRGVVEIYNAWRAITNLQSPLLLVGESPSEELYQLVCRSPYRKDIHFISGKGNDFIRHAYCGARMLLFPSLAEGFGWPISEAMACGCPVITTNEAPMTEVGGHAALYIDRMPSKGLKVMFWAEHAAGLMEKTICAPDHVVRSRIDAGIKNSERFDLKAALNRIEEIYLEVV